MLIRKLRDCVQFAAGDNTNLRELLHPDRDYRFHGRYSLAHAVLGPGKSSLRHRLETDEVYYVLSGHGVVHIDDAAVDVEPGDSIDIPPGSVQWIENIGSGDLAFLCIVDPAWKAEDEEVLE